ncbi:hypothetical protein B0H63DRAFT_519590 [Podospora didyma]|uniref:Oxidase ustYa n=1 Tax=Podospora didyma TaxID=330526 RepID=A0AAE0NYY3_9PEZI|nr:hypothetical protein B0H63DRAFT_519590 [Podospora didyma]
MPSIKRSAYSLLEGGGPAQKRAGHCSSPIWPKLLVLFGGLFVTCLSFALGRVSAGHDISSSIFNIPGLSLKTSPHVFIYNRTFAEKSDAADAAWSVLFPRQAGYFTHPTVAPHRSTFSVYHYLHCLNGIRMGYWAVHDAAVAGQKLNDSSLPMMISPPHVRHCIDLLRQTLMCNADLTVEVKDEKAGGVHGFGETHQCIDWEALGSWTTAHEKRKKGAANSPDSESKVEHEHVHGHHSS